MVFWRLSSLKNDEFWKWVLGKNPPRTPYGGHFSGGIFSWHPENAVLEAQLKISFYFMKKSCSDPEIFDFSFIFIHIINFQKQPSRGFLKKVLKIRSKFAGEYPCRNAISVKLQSNFIEITLWHGCSPINLLHIFRTPFPKNTSGRSNFESCDVVMSSWSGVLKDTR